MDLLKILDAKPEPTIATEHFEVEEKYQLSNDYKIPTGLSDFQKELIDQIVSLHYSDILKFFERVDDTQENDRVIVDSLETMLLNTQLVCSHPYLLIDHYFPKSLTARDIPKRLSETSGKFKILSDLLNILDSIYNVKGKQSIDIAIIARPGKTLDLIDALCIGHKCNFKRYSGTKLKESAGANKKNVNLNVHLFPSDSKDFTSEPNTRMKIIISFDISCSLDHDRILRLRNRSTKILHLVPINTIEHIALYFRNQVETRNYNDYLKPVTAAAVVLRDRAGQLPLELRPIYNKNLEFLSNWMRDPEVHRWPLLDMPIIPTYTSNDVERSLLTEVKFNFDNDDFLKEEETKDSDLNLNFNFSGKTKMIGHIIQPRFKSNHQKKTDFYESKRLEKKYLFNVLNSDNKTLTGISKDIAMDQILTHTLMFHFGQRLQELIAKNEELRSFDEYYGAHSKNIEEIMATYRKISSELQEREDSAARSSKEVTASSERIAVHKENIQTYKHEIEEITSKKDNFEETASLWLKYDSELVHLEEEIEKLEGKIEAATNESSYMTAELERASTSIVESEKEIAEKQTQIGLLRQQVESLKKQDDEDRLQKLEAAKKEYESTLRKNQLLQEAMETSFKKVTDSESRSRYVNYSRNGLLSKKNAGATV
ncbi:hypothetical protein OGAPHI_003418 [Ogataea philodendri]|uniref:HDA1 complex subunit 3 n=1 Tax=Ogataea philodendri TaxID=1378263 RepID=A0A9P8P707_9ASCO|nr:uncharacterized protein OGAPHI_003418 [Ogataea philodendri]KAH3666968.1 hypothetical protein OGAPHI_003418 [Ogataea philodendri]